MLHQLNLVKPVLKSNSMKKFLLLRKNNLNPQMALTLLMRTRLLKKLRTNPLMMVLTLPKVVPQKAKRELLMVRMLNPKARKAILKLRALPKVAPMLKEVLKEAKVRTLRAVRLPLKQGPDTQRRRKMKSCSPATITDSSG